MVRTHTHTHTVDNTTSALRRGVVTPCKVFFFKELNITKWQLIRRRKWKYSWFGSLSMVFCNLCSKIGFYLWILKELSCSSRIPSCKPWKVCSWVGSSNLYLTLPFVPLNVADLMESCLAPSPDVQKKLVTSSCCLITLNFHLSCAPLSPACYEMPRITEWAHWVVHSFSGALLHFRTKTKQKTHFGTKSGHLRSKLRFTPKRLFLSKCDNVQSQKQWTKLQPTNCACANWV